jgi:hypothetical protein
MKATCHAPGCEQQATHGRVPAAGVASPFTLYEGPTFCHSHWWQIPIGWRPAIRDGAHHTVTRAQALLASEPKKAPPDHE